MNSRLQDRKKKLVQDFSEKFSKIINGGAVIKFLDVSGFNSETFTGVHSITPPLELGFLLIPVINIEGFETTVPIVVRPSSYNNFVSFLQCIVAATSYYRSVFDILESVNTKISFIAISSPKIKRLPSPSPSPSPSRLRTSSLGWAFP